MLDALHQLPTASLRGLASSLRSGVLSAGISNRALQQIAGAQAAALETCLTGLQQTGMTPAGIAEVAEAIADARERLPDADRLIDLVLSGPDVPGVPTSDTAATMHSLVAEAATEVLLVGYAVHHCRALFERLAGKMKANPALRVTFCLEVSRPYGDTSLAAEIVRRFAQDFRAKHWPWPESPELFYDPRSLSENLAERSSLHAKCLVIDRRLALITSANFTEAAQARNIEAGILVRHQPLVERLVTYFEGLRAAGVLARCGLG